MRERECVCVYERKRERECVGEREKKNIERETKIEKKLSLSQICLQRQTGLFLAFQSAILYPLGRAAKHSSTCTLNNIIT